MVSNVGSSSFKYQIIDMDNEITLAKGNIERVGKPTSIFTHYLKDKKAFEEIIYVPDHNSAVKHAIEAILDPKFGVLKELSELSGVGFKAVFTKGITGSALINEGFIKALEEYIPLTPFHNPAYIASIRAF